MKKKIGRQEKKGEVESNYVSRYSFMSTGLQTGEKGKKGLKRPCSKRSTKPIRRYRGGREQEG